MGAIFYIKHGCRNISPWITRLSERKDYRHNQPPSTIATFISVKKNNDGHYKYLNDFTLQRDVGRISYRIVPVQGCINVSIIILSVLEMCKVHMAGLSTQSPSCLRCSQLR